MVNCFFDHQNFYLGGHPFYPVISSSLDNLDCNTVIITLDCSNTSTLAFDNHQKVAEFVKSQNKYIVWDIKLDLEKPNFPMYDELYLKSILHSLKYFITKLYTPFKDISIGVILYSGKIPQYQLADESFSSRLNNFSNQQKEGFSSSYLKQLFSCDLLADYLRFIAPNIPDELPMIIRLDVSDIKSSSHLMHLLTKERFEYFLLALKGSKLAIPAIQCEHGKGELGQIDSKDRVLKKESPKVGVCFVSSKKTTKAELEQFDKIFHDLTSANIDYRILEEIFVTNEWDGLDYIIARQSSLSLHGKRALQGFYAASGITVYHDFPIGVLNELNFDTFKTSFPEDYLDITT